MLVIEECASSLTATRQRRPADAGPALRLATSRATTRADRFPAEPPETKHPPAVGGIPARSAISRSTMFSAWIAPAASSQEMPWMDAQEISMSNSSEALVGAAGMNPRKRGLSAEITAGAMHRRVHAEHLVGSVRPGAGQPLQGRVELGRVPGALVERDRVQPQPVLRVGEHGPDHRLRCRIHTVHGRTTYGLTCALGAARTKIWPGRRYQPR